MRRVVPAMLAMTAVAAGAWAVPAARGAVSPGAFGAAVSWGRAIGVPGLAALNKGASEVDEVSCASAGNCAAVGDYTDRDGDGQVFVAGERNGRWGKAIEVPGLAALNASGGAEFDSVSCASAGDCAAGGGYTDRHHHQQGFVVDERNGAWGTAIEVPGLGILNKGGQAEFNSVSCASAGNCVAGGDYEDRNGDTQGYVADERNGAWGTAIDVPGLVALNKGDAEVDSVSCASAGNCAAVGIHSDRHGNEQGFVADERNGAWGTAIPVPGLAALNKGEVDVNSVSCASPGNCAAGGDYDGRRDQQGFVAVERNGSWGRAIGVPGLAALNKDGLASVRSVSCPSPGNCAAGGDFYDGHENMRGFVVAERNGRWTKAIAVSGSGALNKSGNVELSEVSCASPGNCAAGGNYTVRHDHGQGFVVAERNGRWTRAHGVPGLRSLNKGGDGAADSVSCPSPGHCTAAGIYRHSGHLQAFVTQAR